MFFEIEYTNTVDLQTKSYETHSSTGQRSLKPDGLTSTSGTCSLSSNSCGKFREVWLEDKRVLQRDSYGVISHSKEFLCEISFRP